MKTDQLVPFTHIDQVQNNVGIPDDLAKHIDKEFQPYLKDMSDLEGDLKRIVSLREPNKSEIPDKAFTKEVKALRLKFVKIRTSLAKTHKENKASYRQVGLYIDNWKNAHLEVTHKIETYLKAIEDYEKNLEIKKREKLQKEREEILVEIVGNPPNDIISMIPDNLGTMEPNLWDMFIQGIRDKVKRMQAEKEQAEKDKAIQRVYDARRKMLWNYRHVLEGEIEDYLSIPDQEYEEVLVKAKRDSTELAKAKQEELRIEKEKHQAERVKQKEVDNATKGINKDSFGFALAIFSHDLQALVTRYEADMIRTSVPDTAERNVWEKSKEHIEKLQFSIKRFIESKK